MPNLLFASLVSLGLLSGFVFSLILIVFLYFDVFSLSVVIGLTVVFNLSMWLIGPYINDFINRFFYKVKFYNPEDVAQKFPHLDELIKQVCQQYQFKYPKIGFIEDKNPTAFTYGSGRYNARIVFTEGIVHFLDTEEQRAVIAHELGHVVNRDFIVMMIASTLLQILYEIYATLIRAKGKKSGGIKLVALLALVLYQIGIFLVYYLSRTREYLADKFATNYVHTQSLANALIKIAYGIVATEDTNQTTRLLNSTRQLGIIDVKNAKHVGAVSYVTNNDPSLIADVALFDKVNPWAKLLQLGSTHPLTGNRLSFLQHLAGIKNEVFVYDLKAAVTRAGLDKNRLWKGFFIDISIIYSPIIVSIISLFIIPLQFIPAVFGVVSLLVILYRYPIGGKTNTTVLSEMRNVYASPVRGKPIKLQGQVIGRGVPGFVFGEDLMFQDSTGLTFLNFESWAGFLGNLFFSIAKVKKIIGEQVGVSGWFYRSYSSHVHLSQLNTNNKTIRSYPWLTQTILPIILILVSLYFVSS